ncbi:hypothetical protein ACHHV8_01985 [Paenibacillus sp. TAB 01]|uniref:hypothetical protein n=1 Tax=Paenibacillus sp. TAB 01 TaxID=3368988 RepID=UPI003751A765
MMQPDLSINDRRQAITRFAARKALELPVQPSGFWFHNDVRDNFYYAIHLYAYCVQPTDCSGLTEQERTSGIELAAGMIRKVLALQVQDPSHPMYGHWPLNLGTDRRPLLLIRCRLN